MEKSKIKLKIITPDNIDIKKTITEYSTIEELKQQIDIFIKESHEAIAAGQKLSITCSSCCNGLNFKNCFKFKTKIKTGKNKVSLT